MKTPLQITFRGFERSDALETHIREKADKLETFRVVHSGEMLYVGCTPCTD